MTEGWVNVQYLCKVKWTASSFVYPDNEDVDHVRNDAMMFVLLQPTTTCGTERAIRRVAFAVYVPCY